MKFKLLVLVILCLLDNSISLSAPETRLKKIQAKISHQSLILEGLSSHIRGEKDLFNVDKKARELLGKAKQAIKSGAWSASIQNIDQYLAINNNHKTDDLLDAYYMLGFTNHQLSNSKESISAYLEYFAILATNTSFQDDRLKTALYQLLDSADQFTDGQWLRLKPLLSSLDVFKASKKNKSAIQMLLGLLAYEKGDYYLAKDWFSGVLQQQDVDETKSRANLYLGLTSFKIGDLDQAKLYFNRILLDKTLADKYVRALAQLNLARIHIIQESFDMGLQIYQKIPKDNPLYKTALYEQILINWRAGRFDKARDCAEEFLKKKDSSPEIRSISKMLPLLLIKSGDLQKARLLISESKRNSEEIKKWLKLQEVAAISSVRSQLDAIVERINPISSLSKDHLQILKMINTLSRLKIQNHNLRVQIRTIIYGLSSVNVDDYFAINSADLDQVEHMVGQLLELGEDLSDVQSSFYSGKISPYVNSILAHNQSLREQLSLQKSSQKILESSHWRETVKVIEYENRLKQSLGQLTMLKANLNSVDYLYSLDEKREVPSERKYLSRMIERYRESTFRGLEIVRARSIKSFLNRSRHKLIKNKIVLATQVFYDDFVEFSPFLQSAELPHEKQMASDIVYTWSSFESLLTQLFEYVDQIEKKMTFKIKGDLADLDRLIEKHQMISKKVGELENQIAGLYERIFDQNRAYYMGNISKYQSLLAKWSGDSYWHDLSEFDRKLKDNSNQLRIEQSQLKAEPAVRGEL